MAPGGESSVDVEARTNVSCATDGLVGGVIGKVRGASALSPRPKMMAHASAPDTPRCRGLRTSIRRR